MHKMVPREEATFFIIEHLAFENANSAYQILLRQMENQKILMNMIE